MSFRKKIILLFCVFSIIPLLALAGLSYWHAKSLLEGAIRGQLQQAAQALTLELDQAERGIMRSLGSLPRPSQPGHVGSSDLLNPITAIPGGSLLERAVYVGLRGGEGSISLLTGSVPGDSVRCSNGLGSRLVTFTSGPTTSEGEGVLEAAFWASDLAFPWSLNTARSVSVVNEVGEVILSTDHCNTLVAGIAVEEALGFDWDLENSGPQGTFQFSDQEGGTLGVFAHMPSQGWTVVVSASVGEILGSLKGLTLFYWFLVLGLGASTALAFSIIIRTYTTSLSELARAAEEIGLGELDPWLPLPASGEVGQLTLAFNQMLERIRTMMDQVDQNGRLVVVGQLSAYLAHEIRNPLSSIKLNLQRLLRWTRSGRLPEYCLEPLEISIKEVERLNDSVTGVLQLSKTQDSPRELVGLHKLLDEAADLVVSRFRRQNVGLSLSLDAEADLVLARPGQLKSAALNLMVNALEAQPGGGHLEIRTTLSRMEELGGPVVSLHFKDEGPGVPADIRDRVFEPFFTHKPGGAGIGLAMAKQSVEENGGQLVLAPSFARKEGAEFVVILPLASFEAMAGIQDFSRDYRSKPPIRVSGTDPNRADEEMEEKAVAPRYLLTPAGLKTALPLSFPDPEERN